MVRFVIAAAAALALVPASASADAVCTLQFDVRMDEQGRFGQDGGGQGICAGNVAGVALDPAAANPSISGVAGPGGACGLTIQDGTLGLRPRRAFEMWAPEHMELAGAWRAVGGALSGTLVTDGVAVDISGSISFAGACSEPGRLYVELLLGNERTAPRAQPEQGASRTEQPAPPKRAKKPKAAKRRSCSRARSPRAAKRCRRAARRR